MFLLSRRTSSGAIAAIILGVLTLSGCGGSNSSPYVSPQVATGATSGNLLPPQGQDMSQTLAADQSIDSALHRKVISCKIVTVTRRTVLKPPPGATVKIPSNVDPATHVFYYAFGKGNSCNSQRTPFYMTIPGDVSIHNRSVTFESGRGSVVLEPDVSYAFYAFAVRAMPAPYVYLIDHTNSSVSVFDSNASGNVAPVRQITNVGGVGGMPQGLAEDARGYIYVTTIAADGTTTSLLVFSPGASGDAKPVRTISGDKTTLTNASSDTGVGPDGSVYVNNSNSIAVFAPSANGNVPPVRLITAINGAGINGAGAAVSSEDQLYTANTVNSTSFIDVFDRDATGNAKPIRSIGGSQTGIASNLVGVDMLSNVYQAPGTAVLEFARYQCGNDLPIRDLTGPATTLTGAQPVAADGAARLFVADEGNGRLLRFAPSADYDTAPLAIISGPNTGLGQPAAMAVGK